MLVAVLLSVFLFGPIFTSLPLGEFLIHPETLAHWRNLLLVKAYVVMPGVFPANPLAGLMNGPLWTIPWSCCATPSLWVLAPWGFPLEAIGMYRASGLSGLLLAMRNADLTGSMRHWFEYPAYFAFGSLLALWQQRFAEHGGVMVLVLLPLSAVLFFGLKLQHTAGCCCFPASGLSWIFARPCLFLAAPGRRPFIWHLCIGMPDTAGSAGDVATLAVCLEPSGRAHAGVGCRLCLLASGRGSRLAFQTSGASFLSLAGVSVAWRIPKASATALIYCALRRLWPSSRRTEISCIDSICPCHFRAIAWGRWRFMCSSLSAAIWFARVGCGHPCGAPFG